MDESTWPMTHPGIVVDGQCMLAASPDRFVGDDGILETKCPFSRRFYKDDIPIHHKAQLLGLLGISGRKWIDYVQWCPNGGIKIKRMDFDEHEWREMKDILQSYVTLHEDAYKPHRASLMKAFADQACDDDEDDDGVESDNFLVPE